MDLLRSIDPSNRTWEVVEMHDKYVVGKIVKDPSETAMGYRRTITHEEWGKWRPVEPTHQDKVDAQAINHVQQLQRENPFPVSTHPADAMEVAKRLVLEDRSAFYDWIEKHVPMDQAEAYAAGIMIAEGRHDEMSFADLNSAANLVMRYRATPAEKIDRLTFMPGKEGEEARAEYLKDQASKEARAAAENTIEGWKKLGFNEEEAVMAEKLDEAGYEVVTDEKIALERLRLDKKRLVEELKNIEDKADYISARIAESNPDITIKRDDLLWLLSWAQSGITSGEASHGIQEENALLERVGEIKKTTEI